MIYDDWRFYAEAQRAGRDTAPFAKACATLTDRRLTGKVTAAAEKSVVKRWLEVCDASSTERNECRAVLDAWVDLEPRKSRSRQRRLHHITRVTERTRRACASHPGGTHSVHWEAMRLRRYVHLLGLDDELALRRRMAAEAKQRAVETRRAEKEGSDEADRDATG